MINRRKLAAGLGGLTLLLGTLGGGIAISAAGPDTGTQVEQADTGTADGPDTGTAQDQQGAQVEDNTPDTGTGAPDTDNVQSDSGSQVEDGTPDVSGAVTP